MRLTRNLLLSRLIQAYVEIARNTPLLLQLFFFERHHPCAARTAPGFSSVRGGLPQQSRGSFLPSLSVERT